jgi:hypothetical protein
MALRPRLTAGLPFRGYTTNSKLRLPPMTTSFMEVAYIPRLTYLERRSN